MVVEWDGVVHVVRGTGAEARLALLHSAGWSRLREMGAQPVGFDVLAIVLALALLMAAAYRGLPVILLAPLCAVLAAGLSGRPLLPTYTTTFMTSAADYIRAFFPLFLLGAVFGKLM